MRFRRTKRAQEAEPPGDAGSAAAPVTAVPDEDEAVEQERHGSLRRTGSEDTADEPEAGAVDRLRRGRAS